MKFILIEISCEDGNPRTRKLTGKSAQDAFDKYMKRTYKEMQEDYGVNDTTIEEWNKDYSKVISRRPITVRELKDNQRAYQRALREYQLRKNKDGVFIVFTENDTYMVVPVKG